MYFCQNCGHSEDHHFSSISIIVWNKRTGKSLPVPRDHDYCKYLIRKYDTPKEIGEHVPGKGTIIYGFRYGDWCMCKDFKPLAKDVISQ